MDFEAAGLLDGLSGRDREARLALLRRLADDGVSVDELRAAVAEDRLALLPVDQVLGGLHTAREIEARTGLPALLLTRFRRLLGLPEPGLDERVFAEEDIEAAAATKLFLDTGLDERSIADITRVLGEAMARLAGTTAAAFVETFLKPGDTEEDVALRFAALASDLTPAVRPVLVAAYNAHLREGVRRGVLARASRESGRFEASQDLAVCFADLVGFTRLGSEAELEEIGAVAGGLARLAAELTVPPVRLIKTIGDAAMFVSPSVAPLVSVARGLVEAVEDADLPSLRAGVAFGPTIASAGDFFGNTVNVASRVTGVARPSSVLCTEEVRDASLEEFDWSFAGRHRLKGIEAPVPLFRARLRVASSSEAPASDVPASEVTRDRRDRRRERRR